MYFSSQCFIFFRTLQNLKSQLVGYRPDHKRTFTYIHIRYYILEKGFCPLFDTVRVNVRVDFNQIRPVFAGGRAIISKFITELLRALTAATAASAWNQRRKMINQNQQVCECWQFPSSNAREAGSAE